jgi:hypothetical protein
VNALTKSKIIAVGLTLFAIVASGGQSLAVTLGVELACASDYYSYCSKYDPDGPEVRACMRRNGTKLSQRCLNALVAAGEVSKEEVSSRSAKERSKTRGHVSEDE